jgi:hypothetical protein
VSQIILLDNEAVQALSTPTHPKQRRVLSHVQVVANRRRRAAEIALAVPTAVRVEAGWDRTDPSWSFANRLRIADTPLDTATANRAAVIHDETGVSVPDAHLGASIRSASAERITVLTSDPDDIQLVAGEVAVTVVTI